MFMGMQTHIAHIYHGERHWVSLSGGRGVTAHNSHCAPMYKEIWWSICLERTETTGGTKWKYGPDSLHIVLQLQRLTHSYVYTNRGLIELKSKSQCDVKAFLMYIITLTNIKIMHSSCYLYVALNVCMFVYQGRRKNGLKKCVLIHTTRSRAVI